MAGPEQPIEPAQDAKSFEASGLEGRLPAAPLERLPVPQEFGWLLPTLLETDTLLTGRWDYWTECMMHGALPDTSIPQLKFLDAPDRAAWKMLTKALDAIPNYSHGGWSGWSGSEYFGYLMEWLLHGFGHAGHVEAPQEPAECEGASERLERLFDLALLQKHPFDYFGAVLAENSYGKRAGFFPTPHGLAELMTQMTIGMSNGDKRALTVCDPCVGTGRLLLHASNHSLRLYGQEINPLLCLSTLVNGYLYAPWLVRPIPYLDWEQYQSNRSRAISDAITAQAPPHQAEVLANTEYDVEEQFRFQPIIKRRAKGSNEDGGEARQGVLF